MAQSQDSRQLKDYEVLGVGACRREQLLHQAGILILETHPELVSATQKVLYEALLAETLQWLKPQEVREVKIKVKVNKSVEDFLRALLFEDFKKQFPQTARTLRTDLHEVLTSYLREFPWQGPLLTEQFRYFPLFLKRKLQDVRLSLMAQREWLWSYLSYADFGFPSPELGRLIVNPSLQTLDIVCEVPELQLQEGLSLFYFDYKQRKVREYKPDIFDAAIVDLLEEDRKYTLDQLLDQVQMLELVEILSRDAWGKKLSYLQSEGIILESGTQWIAGRK